MRHIALGRTERMFKRPQERQINRSAVNWQIIITIIIIEMKQKTQSE